MLHKKKYTYIYATSYWFHRCILLGRLDGERVFVLFLISLGPVLTFVDTPGEIMGSVTCFGSIGICQSQVVSQ